ncbi:MAG: hypothetical protein KJ941_11270 [Bacteroidetes bacterium]|nr:hypothetical protein [Bacteroidota bacterium]
MLLFVKQSAILFFLLIGLFSCQQNYGNKLESNELDLYYTRIEDENFARQVGNYWKNNNFLNDQKQSLQLDFIENTYYLKLISKDTSSLKNMSFEERNILITLQNDLRKEIFPKHNFNLVLCDNQFKPLYDINN